MDYINNISNRKRKFEIVRNLGKEYKGILDEKMLNEKRPNGICHWRLFLGYISNDDEKISDNLKGRDPFKIDQLAWLRYILDFILGPLGFSVQMYDKTGLRFTEGRTLGLNISFIRVERSDNKHLLYAVKDGKIILSEFEYVYDDKTTLKRLIKDRFDDSPCEMIFYLNLCNLN